MVNNELIGSSLIKWSMCRHTQDLLAQCKSGPDVFNALGNATIDPQLLLGSQPFAGIEMEHSLCSRTLGNLVDSRTAFRCICCTIEFLKATRLHQSSAPHAS